VLGGPRELDDEQRIPLRALDRREVRGAGVPGELQRVLVVERLELDEEPVSARTQPGGLYELRPGRRDKEERTARQREPVDDPHRRVVGPMKVLEPDDRRRVRRAGREVAAPRVNDLVGALFVLHSA